MKRRKASLTPSAFKEAAECLRTLAHPHRLQIVQLLLSGSFTVGELAEECGIASHVCSEHLRTMERCGFLSSSRAGRSVLYRVTEPHIEQILECVEARFL